MQARKAARGGLLVSPRPLSRRAATRGGEEQGQRLAPPAMASRRHSASGQFPVLAAQTARYLYFELKDFKEGRRSDPAMAPFVAKLSREDMLDLPTTSPPRSRSRLRSGGCGARRPRQEKAEEVLCTMCHLGGFAGQNEIPRVAGQHPEYVNQAAEGLQGAHAHQPMPAA